MEASKRWDGPVLDNHFHLNRNGRYLDAAHDFKKAGGTDIVLVHCPDFSAPPTEKVGHTETYADTVKMAEEVRKKVGLGVRVVLGPHERQDRPFYEPLQPFLPCQHTSQCAQLSR